MTRRRALVAVTAVAITVAVAVPAWAYLDSTTQTPLALAVATLGLPGASVTVDGRDAVITPVPPASGPAPAFYSVGLVTDGGLVAVCPYLSPASMCVDPGAAAPDAAGPSPRYVVTAHLGRFWTRDTDPLGLPVPAAPVPDAGGPAAAPTSADTGAPAAHGGGENGGGAGGDGPKGTGPAWQGSGEVERERPTADPAPVPPVTRDEPAPSDPGRPDAAGPAPSGLDPSALDPSALDASGPDSSALHPSGPDGPATGSVHFDAPGFEPPSAPGLNP